MSPVYRWDLFKAQDSTAKRVQKSETFRNYTEYRKLIKLLNMVILEAKWGKKKNSIKKAESLLSAADRLKSDLWI